MIEAPHYSAAGAKRDATFAPAGVACGNRLRGLQLAWSAQSGISNHVGLWGQPEIWMRSSTWLAVRRPG